jgi:hypothetical protein
MKPLEQIVYTLIINGTLTEQPGLWYGKTGIAVFFFHHARYTGNELFMDYAMDLMEEIQKQITVTVSVRYDAGLAGIGVVCEYVLQNGCLEAEDNDIFEEFDARMYRAAMYEPYPDLSLQEGLSGWGRYFIYRLCGDGQKNGKLHEALRHIAEKMAQKVAQNAVPENEQPDVYRFFYDLTALPEYAYQYGKSFHRCREWNCIRRPDVQKLFPSMGNLQRLYVCQKYFNMDVAEEIGQEWKKWEEANNSALPGMGLVNGWAAMGLLYLTSFHRQDASWINLL